MTKKQIDKSNSTLQHSDSNNVDSRPLDCFGDKSPRNDGNIVNHKATSDSAEVSLDNFVGFQARNCEIEHRVHRAVECAESRESAKETNARDEREQPKLRPIIKGANGLSLGISIVVAILLGIGAGILMQKIFGVFWVLFLGVAWGIAAAVLNVYKVYKAELRDFEKIANDPKYKSANP